MGMPAYCSEEPVYQSHSPVFIRVIHITYEILLYKELEQLNKKPTKEYSFTF